MNNISILLLISLWLTLSVFAYIFFEEYDIVPKWIVIVLSFPVWFLLEILPKLFEKIDKLLRKIERRRIERKNKNGGVR